MKLNSPVTVNMHGTDIVLEDLGLAIMDMPKSKIVLVKIHPAAKPIVLWKKDQYDEIGDYTQAQLEARLLDMLNADGKLQENVENLFKVELL